GKKEAFDGPEGFSYCYLPKPISPGNIFPVRKDEVPAESFNDDPVGYGALFREFLNKVGELDHEGVSMEMWFDHFESLMMLYTSTIPALGTGDGIPDATLYDHCKATSAMAAALHLYHTHTGTLDPKSIKEFGENKFLVVSGSFQGIQNFIFGGGGESQKYRSKLLRGRSFAVTLLSELAADMLCREIGLPGASVIIDAAGKFAILAPNTDHARRRVEMVEEIINDWLVKASHGEIVVGLSLQVAAPRDFVSGAFSDLWERISHAMEEKKYSSIDLGHYGGAVEGYLDSFNNDLESDICPICHKRPSEKKVEGSHYIRDVKSACSLCRDHIYLGANLVKKSRMAILAPGSLADDREERLFDPIFNEYQIAFVETFPGDHAKKGDLLKYWSLNFYREKTVPVNTTVKFINGYVPVYGSGDAGDERLLSEVSEAKRGALITELKKADGDPKTLNHIARCALNSGRDGSGVKGVDALGVLKADVDDLGLMMACGLNARKFSLSRLTTLSRQLHHYFTMHLPGFLLTHEAYRDVYTVFAGGDDLFLIGPWNRIIELAMELRESFSDYACRNDHVHFSAGISLHKSHTPVDAMADAAEAELDKSKTASEEKNSLTLFSETASWARAAEYTKIKQDLEKWLDQGIINKAMLYRLNELIDMVDREKRVAVEDCAHVKDLDFTKWQSKLAYTCVRNVARNKKGGSRSEEKREIIKKIHGALLAWLKEHDARLKIPVWRILYNLR
ncbi:MAG: type III-A CRISPR-associated protein Cas10/Csm1, partial [Desulfobacterales bacterium]|nr:type III-A CRISPR-associated protein Cas10/Csm1 [Desulfobacterales bacterium]